jgi:MFS family permease
VTAIAVPGIMGAACGDQFGPVMASASLGMITIFLGIGQVLGPILGGRLADSYGTLEYSYLMAAGVFVVGAALALLLRETAWRAALDERSAADDPGVLCVGAVPPPAEPSPLEGA